MIVSSRAAVTLVGGGHCGPTDINSALRHAPNLVAADGGAGRVLAEGLRPLAVIGDMDSLSAEAHAAFADLLQIVPEQDTTDFEKCLTRISAPLVLGVGFLGGRVDHELAVFNTMTRHAGRAIVLLGSDDVVTLLPPALTLDLSAGSRLSLMPLGPARVWSSGLRWDLSGQDMAPDGFLSISNEVAGPVMLRCEGPVLLITPRAALAPVVAAVTGAVRGQ
ncbi:thiamine diphosphokinase [Marivivens marinus]|uniref:thiamine diphosphokinase n=1 Tax=Marivivens marinus TaxID=3110173 RepID=UPI003B847A9F